MSLEKILPISDLMNRMSKLFHGKKNVDIHQSLIFTLAYMIARHGDRKKIMEETIESLNSALDIIDCENLEK